MPRTDRHPDTAEISALLVRAAEFVAAGRSAEAIPTLRDAACAQPSNAAIQHDLGFLCLQAARLPEAVAAFRAALAADPCFAQASLCLGIALQEQGDTAGALAAYRHAASLKPSLTMAHLCLGALLESLGNREQAITSFRQGAASAPQSILGQLSDARALLAEDRDADAEPVLLELLALHPTNGMGNDMLAMVFADTGRFDKARECYLRAVAAARNLAGSYYDLVRCRRITDEDADLLARMRAALAAPGLTADIRLKVHLGLGKALDDLGNFAEAMTHFDAADGLRSSLQTFDAAAFEARVERLITHFTLDLVARAPGFGFADRAPVFILGLPRSGTTLVEQILSCHPQVYGGGELPFWTERGARWERTNAADAESTDFARIGSEYVGFLHALAPQAARVTDKMPLNVLWAGLIHLALPGATIIHCRRSAIDTALSIHRTYFNPYVALPTGGTALVAAIRAVERLAAHWRAVLPANRFFDVDYEELIDDPEPVIRRLVMACDLPWHDGCLRPERNPRLIKTPSKWQARQPINRGALESWRRYEPWLGPLAALISGPQPRGG
jgi:Flp pilus assembly protein TadD